MADGRHIANRKIATFQWKIIRWSSGCHQVWVLSYTKRHQYLIIFHYGDLTICNIAAVRQLTFRNLDYNVTWPLSPCYSASLCKISLKSDNRLLSYGQKRFLKWRPSAILNLKIIHLWLLDCYRAPNVVFCTKFHQNQIIFRWDMAI